MAAECVDFGPEMEADASHGQMPLCKFKSGGLSFVLEAAAGLMGGVASLGLEAVVQESDIRNRICMFYSVDCKQNAI